MFRCLVGISLIDQHKRFSSKLLTDFRDVNLQHYLILDDMNSMNESLSISFIGSLQMVLTVWMEKLIPELVACRAEQDPPDFDLSSFDVIQSPLQSASTSPPETSQPQNNPGNGIKPQRQSSTESYTTSSVLYVRK